MRFCRVVVVTFQDAHEILLQARAGGRVGDPPLHNARPDPPRDFTDPAWRRRTSPRRIFFTIREGSRGTPMPAWGILTDDEIWDLTACLISTGEGR